ncbi:MAG: hypothetical protein ACYC4R_00825 [Anaerolineae bacterium]
MHCTLARTLTLVGLMAFLVGCTATPAPPADATAVPTVAESTPAPEDAYPAPAVTDAAYPAPEATAANSSATPFPTPVLETPVAPQADPEAGSVTGVIARQNLGMPGEALSATTLYLAELLLDDQGELAGLAALEEESAPRAETNAQGQFIFEGLASGHYALIVKGPLGLVPARDLVSGTDVVIEVEAGQVIELGELRIELSY